MQEGDEPAEDMKTLHIELDDCLADLEDIVYRINRTNMHTVCDGVTLTRMIARKDALNLRLSVMREVLKHVVETDRYGRNEIRYIRTVDVAEMRKEFDVYAKQLRELDLKLQNWNWITDLL